MVPVRILERNEREIGTTLRVAPGNARLLAGVVEWAAGEVKDLAYLDAAGEQVGTGGFDIIDIQYEAVSRAGLRRRDAVAEDDRSRRVVRRDLHDPEVVARSEVRI